MTGAVTVRIAFENDGREVSDGGLSGKGRFTASGAIVDKGTTRIYRTETKTEIILRNVNVGEKGTITFVVTIDLAHATSRWTIASGTKAYQGLHGEGSERENATLDPQHADRSGVALSARPTGADSGPSAGGPSRFGRITRARTSGCRTPLRSARCRTRTRRGRSSGSPGPVRCPSG